MENVDLRIKHPITNLEIPEKIEYTKQIRSIDDLAHKRLTVPDPRVVLEAC